MYVRVCITTNEKNKIKVGVVDFYFITSLDILYFFPSLQDV